MIHERGYWTDHAETNTHMFDEDLCKEIIRQFPGFDFVDIGCGDGSYTKHLLNAGNNCKGYDGSPLTPELTDGLCKIKDFSKPVSIGKYDVVLCLEVGEHIPEKYEQIFIDNIVKASKKFIILSWAIEGQPGTGHVNCKNNGYIINEMSKRGLEYIPELSAALRLASKFPWFRDTLMVFQW